ncbi:MAG: hypothetical protein Cpurp_13030 [Chlorogloea purpurea SAG 13.99]|nr:hypothetical protein [Chlorogloea purpurea SAG 13.99]
MQQRAISWQQLELVFDYGTINHDRRTMSRKEALKLLGMWRREIKLNRNIMKDQQEKMRILKQVIDKGGIEAIVVADEIITTYAYRSKKTWKKRKRRRNQNENARPVPQNIVSAS